MYTTIVPNSKDLMMPLLKLASDGRELVKYMNKIVFITILAIAATSAAMAQVGTRFSDNGLRFVVTAVNPNEVAVISNPPNRYSGSINIPSSVTYGGAVYSVTSIRDWAFSGCSSLTDINIPNSVTEIVDGAFRRSGITNINVSSSNPKFTSDNGILFSKNMDTLICYPTGKTNSTYTIPNSVTAIGGEAFSGCSRLTNINIPNSVTSIGGGAFSECSSLTDINIPNSVTSIENVTFSGCSSLTAVNIPNSVTAIGDGAFGDCSRLTTVNIPNSVTEIGSVAFRRSGITDINVSSSNPKFTSDNGVLFSKNMDTLICYPPGKTNSTYTVPNSVTEIGNSAFSECSSLTTVNIPNSVNAIGLHAFLDCSSLTSVNIPNSVTKIEYQAFSGCSSLTTVNIPNSVTAIEWFAFMGCSSLTTINIPNSVTEIGNWAFSSSGITDINVSSSNPKFTSDNGILFSKNMDTLICYPPGKTNSTYTIPNSVNAIGERAFYECKSLTTINIPNSVNAIGKWAFNGCRSLKKIKLDVTDPASITLGSDVFYGVPRGSYPDACVLLVPAGSAYSYRNRGGWDEFSPNIFEPQNVNVD